MGTTYTRRDFVKAAGAASLAGCTGSGNPTDTPSTAVHEAAEAFRSLLEREARDTEYLRPAAAEGGFVEVTKTGEATYEVTVGSTDFTDASPCAGGEPSTQTVKNAFEPGLGYPRWLGTFAAEMYERLGPLNVAYRDAGDAAVETYAFRFEKGATTITYAASGEQMADWAFEDDHLDRGMFEDAFFDGMTVSCSSVTGSTNTETGTRAEDTTETCAAPEIRVEAANGYDLSASGIGRVSLLLRVSSDCTFDVAESQLQWIGPEASETVTPDVAPSDAAVVAEARTDSDGSFPELNAAEDRAVVDIDLTRISAPLAPGSSAMVRFQRGPTVTVTAPDPLPDEEPVTLA